MFARRRKRAKTVLERKVRLLFGLTLLALLSASFYIANNRVEAIVIDEHRRTARTALAAVLVSDHLQWMDKKHKGGFSTGLGFRHFLETSQPYTRRYYATGTPHDASPRDDFEREAIDALLAGRAQERHRVIAGENIRRYQFMTVLRNRGPCQRCHGPPDPAAPQGDVLGVVGIQLQMHGSDALLRINRLFLLYAATVTVVVALVLLYAIVRWVITRPVAHLKQVSDRVSTGDLSVRTALHTGDEFEEFGRAFNRMLDTIAANEAELRRVNADLDAKVEQLAFANLSLYEMNRVKSEFVATMTHELRTPLNAILGFSELLRDGAADRLDQRQRRFIENIHSSGEHLLEMINNILDLAKIESGKMELDLQEVSVGNVCRSLAAGFEPLVASKGLSLDVEVADSLPLVVTDEGKLRQIVYNLLGNAVKFTPSGGRITLRAAPAGEGVRIDVADTGVGIPPEEIPAIFERFKQVDSSPSRPYDGSGLGLAIVYELLRLLGGEVTVQSEPGKGSTFTVILPAAPPGRKGTARGGGEVESVAGLPGPEVSHPIRNAGRNETDRPPVT